MVSALFCDLVDSVPLTQRLDLEDLSDVMDSYLAVCTDVIGRHGGHVVQYMGDGILAYFGYPRADDDDAANAVRAALEVRDAVARLDLPAAGPLAVRAAVATGLVVISDVSGGAAGRTKGIVGETPNLAARLQSIAPKGGVVVAAATERLTRGQIIYRHLGAQMLKGFGEPVPVYEAVQAIDGSGRAPIRKADLQTPLVGRDEELARLLRLWEAVRRGQGRVLLLRGEAGVGKSRLVDELRRAAADQPRAQMIWYCGPTHQHTPLYPISHQIARAAGFEALDGPEVREAKFERLLSEYGEVDARSRAMLANLAGLSSGTDAAIAALTPGKRRTVSVDTALAMVDRVAGVGPAVFVLEDAQWADSTTEGWLEQVVELAAARPWLFIVTARSDYDPAWSQRPGIQRIDLPRLQRGDSERLCLHVGGSGRLPGRVIRQIVERCDGIPLFVEEMTRSVVEAAATEAAVTIPTSVQSSLVARLDRLGPARPVANLAAAIGRRFSRSLLAAVAELPDTELDRSLRRLRQSGLVERQGRPEAALYRFKHALIRDAAYQSMLKRDREAIHGRIANVLRAKFPVVGDTEPELLAYHFTQSGAFQEAVPLWAEAARRASASGAHLEAASQFQAAIDVLRRLPKTDLRGVMELPLLIGLATSVGGSRGFGAAEVLKPLNEAREICDAFGDVAGLYPVLMGLSTFATFSHNMQLAESLAARALAIAQQTGAPEQKIEALREFGTTHMLCGRLEKAKFYMEESLALYRNSDGGNLKYVLPQDALATVHAGLAYIYFGLGDVPAAEAHVTRALARARELGDPLTLVVCCAAVGQISVMDRQFERALAFTDEGLGLCNEHGFVTFRDVVAAQRASALGNLGDPHKGLELAWEIDRRLLAGQEGDLKGFGRALIAELTAIAGEPLEALRLIDEAIESVRSRDELYYLPLMYIYRAQIQRRIPGMSPEAAVESLHDAIAMGNRLGAGGFVRRAEAMLTEAWACAGAPNASLSAPPTPSSPGDQGRTLNA